MPTTSLRSMSSALVVLVLFAAATGCASTGAAPAHRTRAVDATGTAKGSPTDRAAPGSQRAASGEHFGDSAAALMERVPGCDSAASLPRDGLASIASLRGRTRLINTVATASQCTLRGQGVVVLAFADARSESAALVQLKSFDGDYSRGTGWVAVPTTTTVAVSGLSAVQEVAAILGGAIGYGGDHG